MKHYYVEGTKTNNPRHDEAIDYLVRRLLEKGRTGLSVCAPVYHGNWLVSDADVLHIERKNGVTHLTRYEIKTGNGRKKARQQANKWYELYADNPGVKTRFVYFNPKEGKYRRMHE